MPVSVCLIFIAGVIWLAAALMVSRLQVMPLAGKARLVLVLTGVPLLGYATYDLGPFVGLAGLLVGAGVLLKCRLPRTPLRYPQD